MRAARRDAVSCVARPPNAPRDSHDSHASHARLAAAPQRADRCARRSAMRSARRRAARELGPAAGNISVCEMKARTFADFR
ncbi:hypothetical protein WS72_00740 [Burkholderia savannae]|uniref:Uncharacterized protein n=1 Tax=Burkholderia savannae TaxID=1637837 RepID=A0ABR5T973_9BURK|nr:hypothetical protein WS91_01245 [Burkholderia sp. MSMB1498]KWZ41554.1 hypothetical protein WS72_00740 [Burkholderia savannae]